MADGLGDNLYLALLHDRTRHRRRRLSLGNEVNNYRLGKRAIIPGDNLRPITGW
ncbi:MAG: hypothetical protein ACR2QJ_11675 [Geminicoccaceae bacterium]